MLKNQNFNAFKLSDALFIIYEHDISCSVESSNLWKMFDNLGAWSSQ